MVAQAERSSRRSQRRADTVAEIKARAMEQVAAVGAEGLSINAVARGMSMAPAALYRYFASKDELLGDLVVDAYDSLADALERAAEATATPAERVAAVLRAYRGWALAHPNSYRLAHHTVSGSGLDLAPDRTKAAAQRGMDVILRALAPLHPRSVAPVDGPLAGEITRWAARSWGPDLPLETLSLGLTCWTRLHGVVSLELGGHLAAMGIDPDPVYEAEIASLLAVAVEPRLEDWSNKSVAARPLIEE